MFTFEIFLAAVRHLMTAAGVYAVAGGFTDEQSFQVFTGEVLGVMGFGWSIWRKYARKARG